MSQDDREMIHPSGPSILPGSALYLLNSNDLLINFTVSTPESESGLCLLTVCAVRHRLCHTVPTEHCRFASLTRSYPSVVSIILRAAVARASVGGRSDLALYFAGVELSLRTSLADFHQPPDPCTAHHQARD